MATEIGSTHQIQVESLTWQIAGFNPVLDLKRDAVMRRLEVIKTSASRDQEAIDAVSTRLGIALANPEVNWHVTVSQLAEFTFEAIQDTARVGLLDVNQEKAWQEGSLFLTKPVIETVLGDKRNVRNAEITYAYAIARRKLVEKESGLTT